MSRSSLIAIASSAFVVVLTSGCASWKPVPYTPNPASVGDPVEDFHRLAMTAKRFRPTKVEMQPTFATLFYTGPAYGGVKSVPVPFKEIEKIVIVTSGGEYAVRALDGAGTPVYEYVAVNQKNAQAMADVLAALSKAILRT